MTKTIILSSGGTGGHVYPAISLAAALEARGYRVVMMTDHRGEVFLQAKGVSQVISLPISRPKGRLGLLSQTIWISLSYCVALYYMLRLRPSAVIGFGGYPSVPALLAGQLLHIPTALHEQNAVLGRSNRLVARFAQRIAVAYPQVKYAKSYDKKTVMTGNPVRSSILAVRETPYKAPTEDESFRIFIMGGSQGARIFSIVIPEAIQILPEEIKQRLSIHQQCRPELVDQTRQAYGDMGVQADVRPFFEAIDQELEGAHLIIGRAGASTIAELSVVGRPAILIPYAFALDNHQQFNAMSLSDIGAAWVILEQDFTPQKLKNVLGEIITNPKLLVDKAKKMKASGRPDATEVLAQVVENLLLKR